ncbi:MAG: PKD domain-containing protein [Crocinitomicaceae bacterium]|nr:PKD domain-containing protein [Crocinitomicaceae bacterium]
MGTIKKVMFRGFINALIAFFCGGIVSAQTAEIHPMNVLFIGNSFTHMNSMPLMFERLAISKSIKINVLMSAKSNHTFKMHSERADLYEDIHKAKWDYVVLQGFSRELSYGNEHIDTAVIPYFQKIVDTLYQNNPCVKLLLYMTWGYENGYAYMNEIGTYEEMSEAIESGYRYLASKYNLAIVPVGNVWKEIRKNYPDYGLYQKDQHHPTKIGSYITASTFYSAIFRSTPEGGYTAGLDDKMALNIQRTAYNYVKEHLSEYKLDSNIVEVNYKFTKDAKYEALCFANYPEATNLTWDFGDGSPGSNEARAVHHYKTFGTYKVKLTVEDACGERIIYKNVYFKEPYKPKSPEPSKPQTKDTSIKKRI